MTTTRRWLARAHGAAMTEKLLVVLFAAVLVGGALMLFGPTLAAKYGWVASMLGAEPEVRTLADARVEREGRDPFVYVLFVMGLASFFAIFIAPVLFPRARRARQEIIVSLVDRFPFLTPLIDPDLLAADHLHELRGLADEVNRQHRENALEIMPRDFGKIAAPSEQTVDASFSEMPAIDALLADAERRAESGPLVVPGASSSAESTMETAVQVPLSARLRAISGDDEIPFDAIDPSAKPQLKPRSEPLQPPPQPIQLGDPDEGFTVDASPAALGFDVDRFAIARQSGALPAVVDPDLEPTVSRDSQPLPSMMDPTVLPETTKPRPVRRPGAGAVDPTTEARTHRPDATTQDFTSTWEPE